MGGGVRRRLLLCVILLVALLARLRGITNPLLDDQAWRQADTASMALHMLGGLTDIPGVFLPQLNYDGVTPQNVELEFPFLPYLLAWTWTIFGWADIWGRIWSVALALIAVGGIYYLGRQMFTDRVGLLAATIYALMPLSIYYGRVVMPEPMAQAWSIWALAMIWRWRNSLEDRGLWKIGLLMAGAILAKLPQLMLFPVALLLGFYPLNPKRIGQIVRFSLIVLLPPMVYYLWVHLNVAPSSQFVSGILGGNMTNSRSLNWSLLGNNIQRGFTGSVLFLSGIGLCRLLFTRSPAQIALLTWSGIGILYMVVVCVRIPLDYYLVPILPLVALLSAYALDRVDFLPGTVLVFLFLVLINRESFEANTYLTPKYHWNEEILSQARWIKDHTPYSSILVLSDPPPMTFYYADRVGFRIISIDDEDIPSEVLNQFPADFLVHLPQSPPKELFWENVRNAYPEIGPGVFDLRVPMYKPR
ncbi:glycosyltransferase [Desulfosporosinus fructosivorans]|uniref:Glycosyltransferase n=1 Tax=Desulfosporosinus fructosivorans TaxID=2018669 RepID=A0A4Z0R558_9FIRM|nr:glycosyltransferase family 39 protein [Desulfosporosinus fructosivorans]TGE37938.1 glycosyltransferase [Desulfosporosinus fructosivorans]